VPAVAGPFWMSALLDFASPDFDRGVPYWSAVTGYAVSPPRGEHDEFATLLPPDGDGYLRVQRLDRGPSRIHLDLHVTDPAAGADAAVSLGAHVVARPDQGYVVLRSPGGFTFCLVRHPAAAVPAARSWPGVRRSRVYQACLDIPSSEYEREHDFWAAMLAASADVLTRRPEFARVRGQRRFALDLLLQRLGEESGRVRAHLDLGTTDRPDEVERHRALGGQVVAEEEFWTVLSDPGGSPYCITDRDPATGRLV
jgi:hypothetical protein